jgi:hypothetical protein
MRAAANLPDSNRCHVALSIPPGCVPTDNGEAIIRGFEACAATLGRGCGFVGPAGGVATVGSCAAEGDFLPVRRCFKGANRLA